MNGARIKTLYQYIECFCLVIITLVIRSIYIGKTDIGADECFSLFYAQFSIPEIINVLSDGDNPPLWEIILHFWIKLFGGSEVSARSLSLLFNVATVVPIYLLGERYIKRRAGLAASLLFALSSFSLFLSHEARVYSLIGFLSITSVYFFISLIKNPSTIKFVFLTIANILLMYGHYLSVWILLMELAVAITIEDKRKVKYIFGHILLLFLFYIPNIPVLFDRFMDSGLHGTWIQRVTSIESLYNMLMTINNAPVTTVFALLLLLAACVKMVCQISKRSFKPATVALLNAFWFFPLIVSFVLSFFVGFFLDRYFYFLSPIFYLALVGCVFFLFPNKKALRASTLVLAIICMAFSFEIDSSKMRYSGNHCRIREVAMKVNSLSLSPNTYVIISPFWIDKQLVYYFDEAHYVFQTQGSLDDLDRPFEQYLANKRISYDCGFLFSDSHMADTCVCVYGVNCPIDDRMLHSYGYAPLDTCSFDRIELVTFAKCKH